MNWRQNLGRNISAVFLLCLTLISVTIYHVANGALQKIDNPNYHSEIEDLLK